MVPEIREWFELERYVAACYYASGAQVFLQGGRCPDGGVDLLVLSGGECTVVQCKHWQKAVGVKELREVVGAREDFRAAHAAFASTKGFTDEAMRFARRNGVELIDESTLLATVACFADTIDFKEAFDYFSRQCPECGSELVKRFNEVTKTAFWGCAAFGKTNCKHTEPYDRRVMEPRRAAS